MAMAAATAAAPPASFPTRNGRRPIHRQLEREVIPDHKGGRDQIRGVDDHAPVVHVLHHAGLAFLVELIVEITPLVFVHLVCREYVTDSDQHFQALTMSSCTRAALCVFGTLFRQIQFATNSVISLDKKGFIVL